MCRFLDEYSVVIGALCTTYCTQKHTSSIHYNLDHRTVHMQRPEQERQARKRREVTQRVTRPCPADLKVILGSREGFITPSNHTNAPYISISNRQCPVHSRDDASSALSPSNRRVGMRSTSGDEMKRHLRNLGKVSVIRELQKEDSVGYDER